MPVREMTPQEVKDWLGKGIVMPGPRPLPQSSVIESQLTDQKYGNVFGPDACKLTNNKPEQENQSSKGE